MASGKFILGMIAGASLGTIAGILMAPDSGASTRRKVIEHTNDLRTLLNDWATDFIESIKTPEQYGYDELESEAPDMKLNTMG